MNWIEELYHITEKDPYSQYGEAKYLEHIFNNIGWIDKRILDIGCGDGVHLSNTKYFSEKGWFVTGLDKINGQFVDVDSISNSLSLNPYYGIVSIDIDGNDYWILNEVLKRPYAGIIVAEFNAHYEDSRTIEYQPDFVWDGSNYYGFSFKAGLHLANKHGYKVIFQNDNLNMYMVREDLIDVEFPEPTFQKIDVFPHSKRTDWIYVN